IHRNGQSIWNGTDDAFLGGYRTEEDPLVVGTLGVYHDPLQFIRSDIFRRKFRPVAGLHWNMLSLLMRKAVRQLRAEGSHEGTAGRSRPPS
ncbi:MAG: hypothetical protein H7322_17020, partial [Ramlibacter sp.]|nr:hypothetical protein [Ramlibacter sp.]